MRHARSPRPARRAAPLLARVTEAPPTAAPASGRGGGASGPRGRPPAGNSKRDAEGVVSGETGRVESVTRRRQGGGNTCRWRARPRAAPAPALRSASGSAQGRGQVSTHQAPQEECFHPRAAQPERGGGGQRGWPGMVCPVGGMLPGGASGSARGDRQGTGTRRRGTPAGPWRRPQRPKPGAEPKPGL